MRVDGPWRRNKATQAVCAAIARDGAQALFVGGCVRNTLLGAEVSDIDIATDATPEQVVALAQAAGIKPVPTGIEHGTVTLVAGGIPHEVTTFRRDVETDGRRAVVAFSTRVEDDASRRDFTMNALYALPDGTLIDPLGGITDLQARHVRFIGSAEDRIREDYLRSLRFFRFHAWYGDPGNGMDPDAIAAIAANLDGLESLSRERVGAETLKLLAAPDPAPAVAGLRSTGALARLLPGADDRVLAPLVHLEAEAGAAPDPIRRLAALGGDLAELLRLSRAQAGALERLRDWTGRAAQAGELAYRLGADAARDVLLLRHALMGTPWDAAATPAVEQGAAARFPVAARDLMPAYTGPALGARLAELERRWIDSGFALTRDDLLG
ncbi:CCA tRNA nucleotidyltransferase [Seohaeicola zhoushanensis]|uniref:CCA tRNA nucleotidyltransferase n=1 Tax=Seohaeicola zhoushanensis TaxID=1569283 RepID=UPI00167B7038|nr:CCA tRNA nucleotidyltransferase [Seohaeicola zhoushanensis]